MNKISLIVLTFAITAICTCCNNDDSDSTTPVQTVVGTEITSSGGTIESPDKNINVTIPAGAVNATVAIEVKEQSNLESNGIGKIYSLTSQEFVKPVTLTLTYSDDELTTKKTYPVLLRLVTRKTASDAWVPVTDFTLDTQTKTIQASVTHFSDWTLVSVGGTLDYMEGTVAHKNLSLTVAVNYSAGGYPATFDALATDRHFAMKVDSTVIGAAYATRSGYLRRIVALGTTPQDTTQLFIEPVASNCYKHADGQTRFQYTQYSKTPGNLVQGTFKVIGTVPTNSNACQNITGSFAYIVK